MDADYGYFEHDADIGVRGSGRSPEEAFVNAARAMFAIQVDPGEVRAIERIEVQFEEGDLELALVQWLNALLAASRERSLAFREFGLAHQAGVWDGWASGERWHRGMARGTEVKGATLTMLAVTASTSGWQARCVVDV